MAQISEVALPDIGDFHDVEIIEILVAPGDRIAVEDSILTLENDKATMEIPSPLAGVVKDIKVALGDRVNQGDLLLSVEVADAAEPPDERDGQVAEPATVSAADANPPDALQQGSDPESDASSAAPPAAAEIVDIPLPDIGDFKDVDVIEVLVTAGDHVAREDSLIALESDKATLEIPSPLAGEIVAVLVDVGDKTNIGDSIARMRPDVAMAAAPAAAPPAASADPAPAGQPVVDERLPGEKEALPRPVIARPSDAPQGKAHASPAVRRFARELGVDLYQVQGSGPKARILKDDVQAYVKRTLAGTSPAAASARGGSLQLPSAPEIDFSQFGEIEEQPLGRIKKLGGAHLHRAWLGVPHVTQFDEADITELESFRKAQKDAAAKQDVRLTFMPFLLQALCRGLREYPQFNSSLAPGGESLILKRYVHIGVAVDTPNGLMVPVLRDVDKKGIFELAADLMAMSGKAREGKLAAGDLQGGCLTVSSLGGIGGTQFAPIVNSPEVAILGVSRARMQPTWDGAGFAPRLIMPFSLSYDHRVIDGAEGVRFTSRLRELLADIRTLLL